MAGKEIDNIGWHIKLLNLRVAICGAMDKLIDKSVTPEYTRDDDMYYKALKDVYETIEKICQD